MRTERTALAALAITFAAAAAASADSEGSRQSGYSYIRVATGGVTIESQANGSVEARRNLPISSGDEIRTADGGRAEIALADGNLLHVGGGTTARFGSLAAQQGDSADFSSIHLVEGSVILSTLGATENEIPRIDTEDVTVYLNPDSRVRVNAEPNRGTVVIGRAGSAEVRTRQGSNAIRAGQYLMARGDEEPEISRGAFSHDRFDLWAADRIETLSDSHSASARYVDEDHASDVVALDGYGDWSYNGTYSTNVWSPRVDSGWTPYSYGSWYYTPVGLTWWSYDPWGWYPFHYGNWFFDAGWGRWCWAPAYVYSPAWVYWGYTPSYVGWCPIGYYSFYSPWWRTYYRNWGWAHHSGVAIAINGTFSARSVDFRGWNFVGAKTFGSAAKSVDVISGSRVAGRLGEQVAISSRPIVVSARGGETREAIREFVRQAPSVIARTASADSSRMAPVLARQETLPPATMEALRQRGAVAERGRLSGPGATDLAPRGALVEQSRSIAAPSSREPVVVGPGPGKDQTNSRGDWRQTEQRVISPPSAPEDWRGRSGNAPLESSAPAAHPSSAETERPSADWRSRSEMPPARRVIEGAVPGRRSLEATDPGASRSREARPSGQWDAPRSAPRTREEAAPPRSAPRSEPRIERAQPPPPPRQAPPPPRPPASSHHDHKTN